MMRLSRSQVKSVVVLAGSLTMFLLFDGNSNNENLRSLAVKSPIVVLNGIELNSDYPVSDDMKKYGSTLPDSYRQHNYCELDSKNKNMSCQKILGESVLRSKPHWHFFGDSQMATMVRMLAGHHYPYEITMKRGAPRNKDRCYLGEYLNIEKSDAWTPPDSKFLQGPAHYGKENPFCSDMNGWGPYVVGNRKRSIEFLNVEFAQDVEIQTTTASTTQEAVAQYLENDHKDDHVCVVNAGLHDQALLNYPDIPKDQFVNNVHSYLKLLEPVCGNLVWVGITEVQELDPTVNLQRNSVSLEWNQQVYSMLASTFPENSFIIDVWKESVAAPFKSDGKQNIHYEDPYYDSFASLFASLL